MQLSDASRELAASELSEDDKAKVAELKARDQEVRTHEQAHIAASGGHAKGQPNYEFEKGPDGRNYAVGGSVDIDTSPIKGDAKATAAKMRAVRRAAQAPAEPSSQDRKVAAEAAATEKEALREVAQERAEQASESGAESRESEVGLESPNRADVADAAQAESSEAPDLSVDRDPQPPTVAPSVGLSGPGGPVGLSPAEGTAEVGVARPVETTGAPREAEEVDGARDSGGAPSPEAVRAPDLDTNSPEDARPPDAKRAFAFDALRQALAIR